jgi:hypothetical protein
VASSKSTLDNLHQKIMNEYTDEFRISLQTQLGEMEALQQRAMSVKNTPSEGEIRSSVNELVAFKMSAFGECIADVESWAIEAKDYLGQKREEKKLEIMNGVDKFSKPISATVAESKADIDPSILELMAQSRKFNHAVNVLKRKSQSLWGWLDASKARLFWIGRDRN